MGNKLQLESVKSDDIVEKLSILGIQSSNAALYMLLKRDPGFSDSTQLTNTQGTIVLIFQALDEPYTMSFAVIPNNNYYIDPSSGDFIGTIKGVIKRSIYNIQSRFGESPQFFYQEINYTNIVQPQEEPLIINVVPKSVVCVVIRGLANRSFKLSEVKQVNAQQRTTEVFTDISQFPDPSKPLESIVKENNNNNNNVGVTGQSRQSRQSWCKWMPLNLGFVSKLLHKMSCSKQK